MPKVSSREPAVHLPRLYVDVSNIARKDAATGIQRVVRAVWEALQEKSGVEFEVVPVAASATWCYRRVPHDFLSRPLRRLPLNWGKARLSPQKGDVFLGLDLSTRVMPRNASQLRQWRSRGVLLSFVTYDLLPVLHPDWFKDKSVRYFRGWLDFVTREADCLACISKAVADDMAHWIDGHDLPAPVIAPIRLGAAIGSSRPSVGMPSNSADILDWVRAGTCAMMVGTIEPRKGHDQVLAAFEHLWANPQPGEDFRLLVVGRPGWKTKAQQQRLRHLHSSSDRLRWIDNASDEFLEHLYGACWGLIQASLGEGFGLPILEAAVHAKPILARDLPVFREIAPRGTEFFTDGNASAFATALRRWRDSGSAAQANLADFSWRNTADDLVRIFQECTSSAAIRS